MYPKVLLALLLFCVVGSTDSNAQDVRNCWSDNYLQECIAADPTIEEKIAEVEAQTEKYYDRLAEQDESKAGTVYTIPVVVHVLYNTAAENISDAQIQSQIDVMNDDFRRTNADASNTPSNFLGVAADTEIEFCMATVDPNGNATTGVTRTSTSVSAFSTGSGCGSGQPMKFDAYGGKDAWDSSKYLNMWVCDLAGGTLGYAQFPNTGCAETDGVVMGYRYFGTIGAAQAPFDGGRTTTHEVGHWLNLRHIWGDGGCSVDDFVSDTPTSDAANYGCATTHTSCSSTDMVQNYMDYSDDACMNLFTAGQKARMRAVLASGGYRNSLITGGACSGSTGGGGGTTGYCASQGNSVADEWIANVTIGTINNSTGANGGYGDFTAQSTDLALGSSNAITLTPGFGGSAYNEYWKVWIDFNADNDFSDSGELVYDAGSVASTAQSGTIAIPSSVATGSTRMRVSMKYNGAQTECEAFDYGEVEDYTVNITAASTPCNVPSGLASGSITGTSAAVSWSSATGASGYTVQYRVTGASTWVTTSSNTTGRTLTGLTACTGYDFRVRSVCSNGNSGYSSVATFTTTGCSTGGYCASQGNSVADEWIAGVAIGSISNSTGADGGYGDYTAQSTDLEQGSSNAITLTPGFAGSAYNEYWKVWIDFNGDNDFSDSGELVYDAGAVSNAAQSGTVAIPSGAATGSTRMRVSMKYNGAQTDCEAFDYGEVEDYTVNIITVTATPCNVPSGLATSGVTGSGATLTWAAASGANSYDIEYRESGTSTWNKTTSNGTSKSISGLASCTSYEFRVSSICSSSNSGYSSAATFTTTGCSTGGGSSYCASAAENSSYFHISNVSVGDMNYTSGDDGGYADYTGQTANVEQGATYTLSATEGSTANYNQDWRVWIDYNQNNTFESSELVLDIADTGNTTVTANITVSANAPVGTTRMRVSMKYYNIPAAQQGACDSFTYGEVEDYTINVSAASGGGTGGGNTGAYCASAGENTSYFHISNVSLGGVNNTSGDDGGYGDYTGQTANLSQGSTYTVSATETATGNYNQDWRVWVDFDQSGTFESGELVLDLADTGNTTVSASFTVPASAAIGNTRMRVSMKYYNIPAAQQDACDSFTYGEVEDYTVNISASTGGGGGGAAPSYCASAGENSSYFHISNVSLGSLNNTSGDDGGYGDYTGSATTLSAGNPYTVSATEGTTYDYDQDWRVWIDYNQNGTYESSELVLDIADTGNTTVSANFTIPAGALNGNTGMRVSMKYYNIPAAQQGACDTFTYGEVEDYEITIINGQRDGGNAVLEVAALALEVFPNPTNGVLNMRTDLHDASQDVTVTVYDMMGRQITQTTETVGAGMYNKRFDVADYPKGYYIINVATETQSVSERFVVMD